MLDPIDPLQKSEEVLSKALGVWLEPVDGCACDPICKTHREHDEKQILIEDMVSAALDQQFKAQREREL